MPGTVDTLINWSEKRHACSSIKDSTNQSKRNVVIDLKRKLLWSADVTRLILSGHSGKGCALPLQGERVAVPAEVWR